MFNLFQPNPSTYLKRASILLHEAQMARVEHQAAAEHHAALARMYAERVRRLEEELYRPSQQAEGASIVKVPDERAPVYSLEGNRRPNLAPAAA